MDQKQMPHDWDATKQEIYNRALEAFKELNLREPTIQEEQELWEAIAFDNE